MNLALPLSLLLLTCSISPALEAQAVGPALAPAPPAAASSAPAAVTQPQMALSPTYVIGAQDSLQIAVWKEPSITGTFPVRPDGKISLALVGEVMAAGRTPQELSDDITERLKKFIQNPTVTVVVAEVNSRKIFVVGEVLRVGPVMLTPEMTPIQALSAAGGLTQFANAKKVYILRGSKDKQKKIPFNYKEALKGNQQGVALQPGDTIVVP